MTRGARIRVRGQVQGVGFRPFVWQLAQRLQISGRVLNDPEGVLIYAAGDDLAAFQTCLKTDAPPLSRIDAIEVEAYDFPETPLGFEIAASQGRGAETRVTPDAATCPDCLDDIRGSDPRRAGYAFTNCTHCGPRFTILHGLPYDRAQTTMAPFAMCADCAAEYADPGDRRFHAQPVACVSCGPQLSLGDATDPIAEAARRLKTGAILAIKGLGGFHLCCDATNADAIETLRTRKRRPGKPLALMGRIDQIDRHARMTASERAALQSAAAPIVLLDRGDPLPKALAPGQNRLGWMLPYTPLHHLLLDAVDRPLVMTSGNLSGEPQVIDTEEAQAKLSGIVDGVLDHNRAIARRLDDSVVQITDDGPMILRRARGLVPETLPLPPGFEDAAQTVAFGAHLKSAICLIKNGQALLSHHLGDLDDLLTWEEFIKADADYAALFDHAPTVFACDLHPDYRSSGHARARAGGPVIEVQHHHAHLAACLAENGWPRTAGPVAGIVLDGLGLGDDGTIWGGELLLGDYAGFTRMTWLTPAPLLGGDGASREPWRNALARLDQAGLSDWADARFYEKPRALLRQAAAQGLNAPLSSSAGRLFDAVAAILALCPDRQSFEGEAAMRLQTLAEGAQRRFSGGDWVDPGDSHDGPVQVDRMIRGLVADLDRGIPKPELAYGFHLWLARVFVAPALALCRSGAAHAIAFSGGCLMNRLLFALLREAAGDAPQMWHKKVPANDGGLALGQAVIAAGHHMPNR